MLLLGKRKQRGKSKNKKRQKRLRRKKFRIVLTREDTLELFEERALIAFDPPKDGNCQFSALCFFLRSICIERSPETLRRHLWRSYYFTGCLKHFQCSNNCSFFPRCGGKHSDSTIYWGWSCPFQPRTLCRRARGASCVPRGRGE